jgi:HEAT repeat protein
MRKFKYFRQIFACLPVLAVAFALLLSSSWARSQEDLSIKQEERSTPAVDALKEALAAPVIDPQDKEELGARRKTLQDRLNDLIGIRDLRLALTLREWRDEGDPDLRKLAAAIDRALALGGALEFVPFSPEEAVALVDRSIHKELEARPTRIVLQGLNSADPTQKIAAATLLGEVGTQLPGTRSRRGFAAAFAPELAKLLKDPNPTVVEAAARALGQINPDPDVAGPALAQVLASGRDSEKEAAAEALVAQIQDINRISTKSVSSSRELKFLGGKETGEDRIRVAGSVVRAASQGLRDNNAIVRRVCAEAMQRAGATLEDVIPTAGAGEAPADISGLARALGDQCRPLAANLKDADGETRLASADALTEIARALARSGRQTTATPAPAKTKGKGADLGAAPAESLQRGLRTALPALIESLRDPDVRVRLAAADVLDLMGQEAALAAGALAEALKDPDIFVRWAAARALGNINPADGKVAVRNLGRLLFDPDLDPRLAAAATLEHYGKDAVDAVPFLARAAGFGDAEGRVAAIHALVAIGPDAKPAVPALAKALSDSDDRVRQAAGEALGSLGPLAQSAEPALRRALNDPEGAVRRAASGALLNLKRE